jgi:flavin-dependent dehydrogenase
MHDAASEQCDVLVVGGGPAGSTAAATLARRGWRVIQAEKDHHPRFHIGESLLPANMPLLEELGALEKVRALGVLKLGADFPSGEDAHRTFHFRESIGATPPYAFQVKREDFDAMLFAHARECGADSREGLRIDNIAFDAQGVSATTRTTDGVAHSIRARYVVDATGRDTFLGNALKIKQKNDNHQSAAIFAHFRGVELRPGEDAGNISIYRFAHGWCWFIPLPDGVMSIGCVCWPAYLKQRRGRTTEFLIETLKTMPDAWSRMTDAHAVSETRVAGNYSYTCREMTGKRWIMAGDAFAFVDPIFSSGVFLAMHSARHASDVVDTALREPAREAQAQRAFDRRIRRGVRSFSWFIYRFNSPAMQHLFAQPSDVWDLRRGVISMLAGDVFDSPRVMSKLRLFKMVYAVTGAMNLRRFLAERRNRRRQAKVAFTGGTTSQDYI